MDDGVIDLTREDSVYAPDARAALFLRPSYGLWRGQVMGYLTSFRVAPRLQMLSPESDNSAINASFLEADEDHPQPNILILLICNWAFLSTFRSAITSSCLSMRKSINLSRSSLLIGYLVRKSATGVAASGVEIGT
jgi:hypothetical protein